MVMKYEIKTATAPSEVIAFSATEDPILMHESKQLIVRENRTAGSGIFQPGETCTHQFECQNRTFNILTLLSQLEPGSPRSRANAHI